MNFVFFPLPRLVTKKKNGGTPGVTFKQLKTTHSFCPRGFAILTPLSRNFSFYSNVDLSYPSLDFERRKGTQTKGNECSVAPYANFLFFYFLNLRKLIV